MAEIGNIGVQSGTDGNYQELVDSIGEIIDLEIRQIRWIAQTSPWIPIDLGAIINGLYESSIATKFKDKKIGGFKGKVAPHKVVEWYLGYKKHPEDLVQSVLDLWEDRWPRPAVKSTVAEGAIADAEPEAPAPKPFSWPNRYGWDVGGIQLEDRQGFKGRFTKEQFHAAMAKVDAVPEDEQYTVEELDRMLAKFGGQKYRVIEALHPEDRYGDNWNPIGEKLLSTGTVTWYESTAPHGYYADERDGDWFVRWNG